MTVVGRHYPPSPIRVLVAQVAQVGFFAAMAFMFIGDAIFEALGVQPPSFYTLAKANQFQTIMAVWLINNCAANLISTGAFEVSYNNKLIFSKLAENRMPTVEEVFAGLNNAAAADPAGWSNAS